jgi:hypothetical protein
MFTQVLAASFKIKRQCKIILISPVVKINVDPASFCITLQYSDIAIPGLLCGPRICVTIKNGTIGKMQIKSPPQNKKKFKHVIAVFQIHIHASITFMFPGS